MIQRALILLATIVVVTNALLNNIIGTLRGGNGFGSPLAPAYGNYGNVGVAYPPYDDAYGGYGYGVGGPLDGLLSGINGGNYGAGYGAGYGGGGMNVISSVMGALNGLMGQLSPVFAQDQYIDGVSAPIAPSYGQSITLG